MPFVFFYFSALTFLSWLASLARLEFIPLLGWSHSHTNTSWSALLRILLCFDNIRIRNCHALWSFFPESSSLMSSCNGVVLQPHPCRNMDGLGCSPFARHYWGIIVYFFINSLVPRCVQPYNDPNNLEDIPFRNLNLKIDFLHPPKPTQHNTSHHLPPKHRPRPPSPLPYFHFPTLTLASQQIDTFPPFTTKITVCLYNMS